MPISVHLVIYLRKRDDHSELQVTAKHLGDDDQQLEVHGLLHMQVPGINSPD